MQGRDSRGAAGGRLRRLRRGKRRASRLERRRLHLPERDCDWCILGLQTFSIPANQQVLDKHFCMHCSRKLLENLSPGHPSSAQALSTIPKIRDNYPERQRSRSLHHFVVILSKQNQDNTTCRIAFTSPSLPHTFHKFY